MPLEADVVRHPIRAVPENYLRQTLAAIREQRTLQIHYQGVNRPEPSERAISPHALGYDGARWHIRAYCHLRQEYRDFVFARILSLSPGSAPEQPAPADDAWNRELKVIIGPHPELSDGQRRVIALDYGMTNEQLVIPTRQALVYYLLKRLGVASSRRRPALEQQIVLLNRDALLPYVPDLTESPSDLQT